MDMIRICKSVSSVSEFTGRYVVLFDRDLLRVSPMFLDADSVLRLQRSTPLRLGRTGATAALLGAAQATQAADEKLRSAALGVDVCSSDCCSSTTQREI